MKADLHIHTTYSDGIKTVSEIFALAKESQMDIISITDHDICKSVPEAIVSSDETKIRFIPGIELSTLHKNKPVHILGYFTDDSFESRDMKDYYSFIKKTREDRTHKFIENLKHFYDIIISYDEVFSYSNGIIARPHIAKAIHKRYPHHSFDYIFENFIGDSSAAFVPSSRLSIKEGIDLLRRNNCVVVLAHPTLLKENIKEEVIKYKYDGLEAIYYRNEENDEETFREIAKSRDMIITAGSDFHGIENDTKHGSVGEISLQGKDLEAFLDFYNKKVSL